MNAGFTPRPLWTAEEGNALQDAFFELFPPDRYADDANRPRAVVLKLIFGELQRLEPVDARRVVEELALGSARVPLPHDVRKAVNDYRTHAQSAARANREQDAKLAAVAERGRLWAATLSPSQLRDACARATRTESVAKRDWLATLDPREHPAWRLRLGWIAPEVVAAAAPATTRPAERAAPAFKIAG